MQLKDLLKKLPYTSPFLFVDELSKVDENGATGTYCFPEDSFFYQGHFKNNPVTPGVILTECMAQIGLVCLGIHLLDPENKMQEGQDASNLQIAMTSTNVEFFLPVYPGEKVTVISKRIYFRFQKLKCEVEMQDSEGNLICKGEIAGMFKTPE